MRRDCEISAVSSLFGHPGIAVALGALLGGLLTFVSHRASSLVTPFDPMRGMVMYGAIMLARMTVALMALGLYFLAAPAGLTAFGVALGFSFVLGLFYEAAKASGLHLSRTSA